MEDFKMPELSNINGFNSQQAAQTPSGKQQFTQGRQYSYSYPIYYQGDTVPQYFGVLTITDIWNQQTNKWEFHCQSQKLYYANGRPVGQ